MENFVPVIGYENLYEVSDQGNVRTLPRKVKFYNGYIRLTTRRLLKPRAERKGYLKVALFNEGVRKDFLVHRLVMLHFVGECPLGHQVCHNNGIANDNRLENLRYDTPCGNAADKIIHGTSGQGRKSNKAILTEEKVIEMRTACPDGKTTKQIAERFGVSQSLLWRVVNRVSWKHVE